MWVYRYTIILINVIFILSKYLFNILVRFDKILKNSKNIIEVNMGEL